MPRGYRNLLGFGENYDFMNLASVFQESQNVPALRSLYSQPLQNAIQLTSGFRISLRADFGLFAKKNLAKRSVQIAAVFGDQSEFANFREASLEIPEKEELARKGILKPLIVNNLRSSEQFRVSFLKKGFCYTKFFLDLSKCYVL